MKCEKCSNYQVDMPGCNEGYYTACKALLTKEEKQAVMDEVKKKCKHFQKM